MSQDVSVEEYYQLIVIAIILKVDGRVFKTHYLQQIQAHLEKLEHIIILKYYIKRKKQYE